MPPELARARWIVGLCDRFHCLPSALMREDVSLLRLVAIEAMGREEKNG